MAEHVDSGGQEWRAGHVGRDVMFYEELHGDKWLRLPIDGEMLVGTRAHHVIYLDSEKRWKLYPTWARSRREEIVKRLVQHFPVPQYAYQVVDT